MRSKSILTIISLIIALSFAGCSTDANVDETLLAQNVPQSRLGIPDEYTVSPENTFFFVNNDGTSVTLDLSTGVAVKAIFEDIKRSKDMYIYKFPGGIRTEIMYYREPDWYISETECHDFWDSDKQGFVQSLNYNWIKIVIDGHTMHLDVEPINDNSMRRVFVVFGGNPCLMNEFMCITQLPPHATEDDYKVALQDLTTEE